MILLIAFLLTMLILSYSKHIVKQRSEHKMVYEVSDKIKKNYDKFVEENEQLIICNKLANKPTIFDFNLEQEYQPCWTIAEKDPYNFTDILKNIEMITNGYYKINCKYKLINDTMFFRVTI